MADNLDELKRLLDDSLGARVTEERSTATVKLVCAPESGEPPFEVYVERMADGYQLTPSPALPDRVNRAINGANERIGAQITRPETDGGQPPLMTPPRPPEEVPDRQAPERRPPGPSLAGIGGSWD